MKFDLKKKPSFEEARQRGREAGKKAAENIAKAFSILTQVMRLLTCAMFLFVMLDFMIGCMFSTFFSVEAAVYWAPIISICLIGSVTILAFLDRERNL